MNLCVIVQPGQHNDTQGSQGEDEEGRKRTEEERKGVKEGEERGMGEIQSKARRKREDGRMEKSEGEGNQRRGWIRAWIRERWVRRGDKERIQGTKDAGGKLTKSNI